VQIARNLLEAGFASLRTFVPKSTAKPQPKYNYKDNSVKKNHISAKILV
jgi:hypothetical protein